MVSHGGESLSGLLLFVAISGYILSNILSDILSDMLSDILSDTLSNIMDGSRAGYPWMDAWLPPPARPPSARAPSEQSAVRPASIHG